MNYLTDNEVELINKFPNLYEKMNKTLNVAYYFFAISLIGCVLGAIVMLTFLN